jgi:hypothetical protein
MMIKQNTKYKIWKHKTVFKKAYIYFSSSSIGTTTLSWVSACSTVVEHSQQGGFTECRYQRHVWPPTWRRTKDLERSNFRHKRPHSVWSDASEPSSGRWNFGREMGKKFYRKWRLPRHFWVLLHAEKHDMGQTALLPLWRKACWGFFRQKNPTASNLGTKGQHATSRPPKPLYIYIYEVHVSRNNLNQNKPALCSTE